MDRVAQTHKEILKRNHEIYAERFNKHSRPTQYEVNNQVWLRNDGSKKNACTKFKKPYKEDRYIIIEVNSPHTVRLRNMTSGKISKRLIHTDRLKHIRDRKVIDDSDSPAPLAMETSTIPPPGGEDVVSDGQQDTPVTIERISQDIDDNAKPKWEKDVFAVKRILKAKGLKGRKSYLIQWEKGENNESYKNSWIPENDVGTEAITEYHRKYNAAGKKRVEFRRK